MGASQSLKPAGESLSQLDRRQSLQSFHCAGGTQKLARPTCWRVWAEPKSKSVPKLYVRVLGKDVEDAAITGKYGKTTQADKWVTDEEMDADSTGDAAVWCFCCCCRGCGEDVWGKEISKIEQALMCGPVAS